MNNARVINKKKPARITPEAMIVIDKKILFSETYSDGLYEYDLESDELNCLGNLYSETQIETCLYHDAVRCRDEVVFAPRWANCISVYNIKTGAVSMTKLPIDYIEIDDKIRRAVLVEDEVYLLGYNINNVLIYNINKKRIDRLIEDKNIKKHELKIQDAAIHNDRLFAVIEDEGSIVEVNPYSKEIRMIEVDKNIAGFSSITSIGNELVLVSFKGDAIVWFDVETEKSHKLSIDGIRVNNAYARGAKYNDMIYLLPAEADELIIIDSDKRKINKRIQLNEIVNVKCDYGFYPPITIGNRIVASMPTMNQLFLFFAEKKEGVILELETNTVPLDMNRRVVRENQYHGIEEYIFFLIGDYNQQIED